MKSMMRMMMGVLAALGAVGVYADTMPFTRHDLPQTWFHMIGGNVSEHGLTADLEALQKAGIGGIQLFHGQMGKPYAWPRTHGQIPCLSDRWDEIVRHAAQECARLGLTFEMQNCPGWSMSGGPWISPDKAMRKLVAFRPGEQPTFDADDDYQGIGTYAFPAPAGWDAPTLTPSRIVTNGTARTFFFAAPVTLRSIVLPPPRGMNHPWSYEPDLTVVLDARDGGFVETPRIAPASRLTAFGGYALPKEGASDWKNIMRRDYPRGCWQDDVPVTFAVPATTAKCFRLTFKNKHPLNGVPFVRLQAVSQLDGWEALAGRVLRDLPPRDSAATHYVQTDKTATLVFGHVNMKIKNGPAPAEATGWECDKLDPAGFRANFDGYLGRLLKGPLAGGLLKGMVVDSWECRTQSWTPRMVEYFTQRNGYDPRPYLPVLFGYMLTDGAAAEAFLRDWRNTVSYLVEENYYRVFSELGHRNGLKVQFETAFQDVIAGDPMRYWKYADVPMCEFWQPFDNAKGFVGSYNFKPVRPCVSAAHIYGKKRVQAEALTSMNLDWDEDFDRFKRVVDLHYVRGVTHLVLHTYTHNPQTGKDFVPPGTSFAWCIGSPFIRGETWWRFMPAFTAYAARCGHELERGLPVVDVLWYLGDDNPYRPDENAAFPKGYKYDYITQDALKERVSVKDGRLTFPDGMTYRMLWIPDGTFLAPESAAKIAALERDGARVCRGALKIDWKSPLEALVQRTPESCEGWYQRRDGDEDIFFILEKNGISRFLYVKNGERRVGDPLTGAITARDGGFVETPRIAPASRLTAFGGYALPKVGATLELKPCAAYPAWATEREYVGTFEHAAGGPTYLDLGKVRSWAEVFVNGQFVRMLWSTPYCCDIGAYLKRGTNEIRVKVTSTWFNALVHDAQLPEAARTTWTIRGPAKTEPYRPAGLVSDGPAKNPKVRLLFGGYL